MKPKLCYTTGQIATLIGCNIRTVNKLVDEKKIIGFRLRSSARRVAHVQLAKYLRSQEGLRAYLKEIGEDDGVA